MYVNLWNNSHIDSCLKTNDFLLDLKQDFSISTTWTENLVNIATSLVLHVVITLEAISTTFCASGDGILKSSLVITLLIASSTIWEWSKDDKNIKPSNQQKTHLPIWPCAVARRSGGVVCAVRRGQHGWNVNCIAHVPVAIPVSCYISMVILYKLVSLLLFIIG